MNKPRVYGCPGNAGKCEEHKSRQWRSKKGFLRHFATHLEEYETLDGYQCLECERRKPTLHVVSSATEIFSHGRELATHMWFQHMVPFTTTKQVQGTAVLGIKKEFESSCDIQRAQAIGTGRDHGLHGRSARAKDDDPARESSGTQRDPLGGSHDDFSWALDEEAYRYDAE